MAILTKFYPSANLSRKILLIVLGALISSSLFAQSDNAIISEKTSKAYLQRFICPPANQQGQSDCFLYFQPYEIGGMTIQAVCNDCFVDWQKNRTTLNEVVLNQRLALIRVDLQPYRDGKNWYVVKWLTIIQ